MAKQVLNNAETHGSIRDKINNNFDETYSHMAEGVSKIINITRDLSMLGNQSVVVPFKIKNLTVFSYVTADEVCDGIWSEDNVGWARYKYGAAINNSNLGSIIFRKPSSSTIIKGNITNVTDTGFEIAWGMVLGESYTGTAVILILANTH